MGLAIGLLLAFLLPLIFLGIIHKLDFYQTGSFNLILLCLMWGGLAYALGAFIDFFLFNFRTGNEEAVIRMYAPIHEEIFKALILLYLVRLPKFTYSFDGALYGFATGIGFAIIENFEYAMNHPSVGDVIQRIFSANLVHASSSAIIGVVLGMFSLRRSSLRWLILAAGLSFGIGQHMFYNMVSLDGESLAAAVGIGSLGLVFISIVMQIGKKQAQSWIKQKLGLDEHIPRGEVAVIDRLPSKKDLLLPVSERFGPQKASQVEKLLYLEARLGIKRRALDSFPTDSDRRKAVESELDEMRMEIKTTRRAIGAYTMLFVRGLFTEEMVSVWEQMQVKIQERSTANGGRKGSGLWSTLEERLKAQKDLEKLDE